MPTPDPPDLLAYAENRYQSFDDARVLWERSEMDTVAYLREAFVAANQVPALIAEIRRLRSEVPPPVNPAVASIAAHRIAPPAEDYEIDRTRADHADKPGVDGGLHALADDIRNRRTP